MKNSSSTEKLIRKINFFFIFKTFLYVGKNDLEKNKPLDTIKLGV